MVLVTHTIKLKEALDVDGSTIQRAFPWMYPLIIREAEHGFESIGIIAN